MVAGHVLVRGAPMAAMVRVLNIWAAMISYEQQCDGKG